MSAVRIPVIGIVGGIGSGKSALANALSNYFQCARLDADAAGHRALAMSPVVNSLKASFGDKIFDSQGKVIRSELARLVFGPDQEHRQARKKLEAIVHPYIRREIVEQLERHQSAEDCDIILLDAALLLEAEWSNDCDAIVYVDVPFEIRRQRVATRNWSAAELIRREASQMSLEDKQQRADLIVDNTQELSVVAETVANWIKERFRITPSDPSTHRVC